MVSSTTPRQRAGGTSLYAAFASFAVVCFVLTLFSDLAYWATASFLWNSASVWLLAIGLGGGGLAIVAGLVDLIRSRTTPGLAQPWLVVLGQVVAFGLSIVNVFVHSRDGYTAVVPQGVALSGLVVLVLLVTAIAGQARAARARVGGLA